MKQRVGLVDALGLEPFAKSAREAHLTLAGDASTPRTRFGLSSLRQLRPRLSVALWLGRAPGRRVPITNLYNYRQPPPEAGWSVRVTDVLDFRGGQNTYDSHNGTDFSVPPGTDVLAAAAGVVLRVSSEYNRGGRKVFLDHGRGLVTTYNHLTRWLVRPGQRVARGERIAISGYSGLDALVGFPWAPPHVHFNVWHNGAYVDPFTPLGDAAPSLWRRFNDPVPCPDPGVADDEPTEWDDDALAALRDACRHDDARGELEGAATRDERFGAALFQLLYFPTRFDRAKLGEGFSLYRRRFEREPRLDLPFAAEDYDGVTFADR
jgi:hypothetical protein